jgi:chromosome segregation ATPase
MGSMMKSSRAVVAGGLLAMAIAVVVSGQAGQPPASARTPMDELLVEVRAIRADLDRAAAASLRGQLLGMRLQLQEQRIAALSRQLSDVQERLRANQQARTTLATSLSMFAGNKEQASAEERQAMNMMFGPLKQQLAALDKADADLKAEESALIGQLQAEQNRWTAFNGQIEELERASAGRNIR